MLPAYCHLSTNAKGETYGVIKNGCGGRKYSGKPWLGVWDETRHLAVFCTTSPANRHSQNSVENIFWNPLGISKLNPGSPVCALLLVGQNMLWEGYSSFKAEKLPVDCLSLYKPTAFCSRAGNFEGFKHANSSYNDNVLKRLYKRINYMGGCVDCAPWRTLKSPDGQLYVEMVQKKPKHCWHRLLGAQCRGKNPPSRRRTPIFCVILVGQAYSGLNSWSWIDVLVKKKGLSTGKRWWERQKLRKDWEYILHQTVPPP